MADDRPNAIVCRARACLGQPFRLHGRDPTTGLDCIGLAAFACTAGPVRTGYVLRGGQEGEIAAALHAIGWNRTNNTAPFHAGALLVLRPGPAQLHLGIWSGTGLIHADARLRRIVERPGHPPWPILSVWTQEEGR